MIKIYSSEYSVKLDDANFFRYLKLMPIEMAEKILRFKRWQDRQASLYGKLLLKKGLDELGFDSSLTNLNYTQYGRPYIPHFPDFNISHSNGFVVCAIATEGKIGVDIEQIKPTPIYDFRNQFSENEWNVIIASDNIYALFYYYWTAKEAAIKANGKGFSLPLENITIKDNKTIIEQTQWYIKRIFLSNTYMLNIACNKIIKQEIQPLKIPL